VLCQLGSHCRERLGGRGTGLRGHPFAGGGFAAGVAVAPRSATVGDQWLRRRETGGPLQPLPGGDIWEKVAVIGLWCSRLQPDRPWGLPSGHSAASSVGAGIPWLNVAGGPKVTLGSWAILANCSFATGFALSRESSEQGTQCRLPASSRPLPARGARSGHATRKQRAGCPTAVSGSITAGKKQKNHHDRRLSRRHRQSRSHSRLNEPGPTLGITAPPAEPASDFIGLQAQHGAGQASHSTGQAAGRGGGTFGKIPPPPRRAVRQGGAPERVGAGWSPTDRLQAAAPGGSLAGMRRPRLAPWAGHWAAGPAPPRRGPGKHQGDRTRPTTGRHRPPLPAATASSRAAKQAAGIGAHQDSSLSLMAAPSRPELGPALAGTAAKAGRCRWGRFQQISSQRAGKLDRP